MAEVPATIEGMHPSLPLINAVAHNTHPMKDALGDALTGIHCTGTTVTHLQNAILLTGVTLMTILWTEANLV